MMLGTSSTWNIQRFHFASCAVLFLFYLPLISAQCSEVSSTEIPSDQICASLHIYKDSTYSERLLQPTTPRDGWIFAGVVSDVFVDAYECWLSSPETEDVYLLLEEGCPVEVTFNVNKGRVGFYKLYGKFLQVMPNVIQNYTINCNVTTKCPAFSGCKILCTENPPRKFLISSVQISVVSETGVVTGDGGSDGNTTTNDTQNLLMIVIIIAAVFLFIFLILLGVLVYRYRKKRRGRYMDNTPVLINNVPNGNTTQNGHAHTHTVDSTYSDARESPIEQDVYAKVNKEPKTEDTAL